MAEEAETAESDETRSPSRRRDGLSTFLTVAIVILGVMGADESRRESNLDAQAQSAEALAKALSLGEDCSVASTGQAGEQLLVSCRNLTLAELAASQGAALPNKAGPSFERIVWRGKDSTWICPANTAPDATACESASTPDKAALRAAKERERAQRKARRGP